MNVCINVWTAILLVITVYQDMKQREISWWLLPLLFIGFSVKGIFFMPAAEFFKSVFYNFGFIVLQLFMLTLYMSIKNKRVVNIINTNLGLGDVLFFAAVGAAFSPFNFILFYLLGLILTLFGFILHTTFFAKKSGKEIPLAGAMALVMLVLLVANSVVPHFDFYNDTYVTSMLTGK